MLEAKLIDQICCINRNIVECKGERVFTISVLGGGINRNIVECKVLERAQELKQETSINRNIVECKGRLTEDIVL